MTIQEWLTFFSQIGKFLGSPEMKDTSGVVIIAAVILITILQVSKAKYNPWSWLAGKIGQSLNSSITKDIGHLRDDIVGLRNSITDIRKQRDEDEILRARRNILTAADEVRRGIPHSEEFFNEILTDIDVYTKYCKAHPEFENSKAEASMELIKSTHYAVTKDNKFV